LRVLLSSQFEWRTDPRKFLRRNAPLLVGTLIGFYDDNCKSKPHELGRSVGSWKAVAAEVRAQFAEEQLAARPSA
jgi:hypothetical protein